jgi:hypothetical protein
MKNATSANLRGRKIVRRSKSGVTAAALQNGTRFRGALWTAAASEARRRFPRRSPADLLKVFSSLVKPSRELISPSRFK